MRTTLTLEPDVEALLRERMYRTGKSFKQAVNDAVRAGLAPEPTAPHAPAVFAFPSFNMGRPLVDVTKGLALAAELEDQEAITKLTQGR